MPSFKQSESEYQNNITTVERKILPSKLAATASNGTLLANWIIKNCAEGDVVDASVENILSAIVALDRAGLVDWEIAPVKKPAKKQPDFLQTNEGRAPNHAHEAQVTEVDIQMAQERKRREKLGEQENGKLMSEAAAICRNHSNYPHSRAIRERTELKKEFDRLVASKAHPKDVLAALKTKQDTFSGADTMRPHYGK